MFVEREECARRGWNAHRHLDGMADLTHKKATAAAKTATGKDEPDPALVTLARALAQDAAEEHFKAESGSARLKDSAQNSPDQDS